MTMLLQVQIHKDIDFTDFALQLRADALEALQPAQPRP